MKISNKLRILFSLTALFVCMCMTSVSVCADTYEDLYGMYETTADDSKRYADGKITENEINELASQYVQLVTSLQTLTDKELEYLIEDSRSSQPKAADIYEEYRDELMGKYNDCTGYNIADIKENKDGVEVLVDVSFGEKSVQMTLNVYCFDGLGNVVDSVGFNTDVKASSDSVDEDSSFGEKMAEAGSNTLLGMGTVFAVLIFISLIIYCFKYISIISDKIAKRKKSKEESANAETVIIPEVNTNIIEDNTELIAVIAAAIAASEQTSTDSFVVRSIRRR